MPRADQNKQMRGARDLPADADVDFVLHTPGRDYDVVDIYDLDDEEFEELADDDDADDIDEEAVTGVWDVPALQPEVSLLEPTQPRPRRPKKQRAQRELSWWEAARMGLRAPTDD